MNHQWQKDFIKGKLHLSKHEPEKAICFFKKALKVCPVFKKNDLNKILFYLGITLKKIGLSTSALRTWCTAGKLVKDSYASKMLKDI